MAEAARPVRVTRRNIAAMQSKENPALLGQKNVLTKQAPTIRATLGEISNRATLISNLGDKKTGLLKSNFSLNPYSNASKENVVEKPKGLAVKPQNRASVVIGKPVTKPSTSGKQLGVAKQVTGVLKRVSSLATAKTGLSVQNVNKPKASLAPSNVKAVLKPKQTEAVSKPAALKEQTLKEPVLVKEEKINVPVEVKPKERDLGGFSSEEILKLEKLDEKDKSDPQNAADYVREIYDYLKELEVIYCVPQDYIKQCKNMTYHMRGTLIDWLVEVHRQFKLLPETLYLAVSIFDRYMPLAPATGKSHLQLVGIVCLLIASKYEEIMCPTVGDCVYMTDKTYTNKQMMEMEMKILAALKFNIGRPLPLHFLRRYTKAANATFEEHAMSKYLMELMLVRHEMCHVNPSLQAAAALCLSMWLNRNKNEVQPIIDMWSSILNYVSGYSASEVQETLRLLTAVVLKGHQSHLTAVRRKYSTKSHAQMSLKVEACLSMITTANL